MERLPKQVYTDTFKLQAVKLVIEKSLSLAEASKQMEIPKSTLVDWVKRAQLKGEESLRTQGNSISDLEAEVSKLKRDLSRMTMERDILKKATAYFAKESLQGMKP